MSVWMRAVQSFVSLDFNAACALSPGPSLAVSLGMGDKLFAVSLEALKLSREEKQFILDVEKECLNGAPGVDKNSWPDTSDLAFGTRVYSYYGYKPRSS